MNQSLPEVVAEIKRLENVRDTLALELIAAGWSWRELGTELGIPGSNAHRKYAPRLTLGRRTVQNGLTAPREAHNSRRAIQRRFQALRP